MAEIHSLNVIPGGADAQPYSIEAEQVLLGSLMLSPDRMAEAIARGGVALFYDPFHAQMFRVMAEKEKAGELVSPVTVAKAGSLQAGFADLGGPGYCARLAGVATLNGLTGYLDILDDIRCKRDLLTAVRAAQNEILNTETSASDVATKLEAVVATLNATSSAVKPVSLMAAATKALAQIDEAYHGKAPNVVKSGIETLDAMLYGFGPGEMALLGGRPSMGKTGVALSIGLNAARAGHGVIFASLEMTPDALAMRAMSEATGLRGGAVSYAQARRGAMTEDQYRNLVASTRQVVELPMQFLPRRFAEPSALFSGVKQCLRYLPSDKMPIVIVDYLQLMQVKGINRFEQITAISLGLKDLAMRLELPVLALSQLSRAVEQRDDKRPMLSDLRESGQLEQDADQIMFCYRDEYYLSKAEPDLSDADAHAAWRQSMEKARNRLEIIVAKQRQGETGTVKVRFNPAINLIWKDDY